jgi:hypothetical protein
MTQLPGLTVATQVEDYVFLNTRTLLTVVLFVGYGYVRSRSIGSATFWATAHVWWFPPLNLRFQIDVPHLT